LAWVRRARRLCFCAARKRENPRLRACVRAHACAALSTYRRALRRCCGVCAPLCRTQRR
jgi:hypothetical protein